MRAWICKEEGELIIGGIWYLIDCRVCKKESGRISCDLQTHGLCSNSITGFLHNKKARPLFGHIKVEIPEDANIALVGNKAAGMWIRYSSRRSG